MSSHLLQEASDIVLAAFGPCQRGGIILQLAGHDVQVPAHWFTVVFLPIMLDAEAAEKHRAQVY